MKLLMPIQSVLLIQTALIASVNAPVLLQDETIGVTRNVVLVGTLGPDELRVLSLRILGPSSVKIGRLLIYPSQEAAEMRFRQTQTSCRPLPIIDSHESRDCPKLAEGLKIGSKLLMRWVDEKCAVKEQILNGTTTPLESFPFDSGSKLVAIAIKTSPRSVEAWGKSYPMVIVFVKTATPNQSVAAVIGSNLKALAGVRDVAVHLRYDTSFGSHCDFPQPFAFDSSYHRSDDHIFSPSSNGLSCVWLYPYPIRCWADR